MNEWTDYKAAHGVPAEHPDKLPVADPALDLLMPLVVWLCILGVAFWFGYTAILWLVKVALLKEQG